MKKTVIWRWLSLLVILTVMLGNGTFLGAQEKTKKEEKSVPSEAETPPPKALYFGDKDDGIHKVLDKAGFKVDISGSDEVISDCKKYQLIAVCKYGVCSHKLADALKDFVGSGGGVIIISGVPAILTIPEPIPDHDGTKASNSDLSYILNSCETCSGYL